MNGAPMNGVVDEVGTMGEETRIYLLPSGALRSLDSQCNYPFFITLYTLL